MNRAVEPPEGAWVIASTGSCPDRLLWQRQGDVWVDEHGCRRAWVSLVAPRRLPTWTWAGVA